MLYYYLVRKLNNSEGRKYKLATKLCDRPEPTIGMELSATSNRLHDCLRKAGEHVGLSQSYRGIMFHLGHEDGLTQLELAKRTNVSPPTVSVTLQKMERAGLLERRPDENDQRSVRVYLTEEGQALNDRIHSEFYKVDMQLVEGFSEDEKQMIRRIFAKMNQNLEGMNL